LSLLSRLLGYVSRQERDGVSLVDPAPWVVPAPTDAAAWLRALPSLFPTGAFVYFEGKMESIFKVWLETHAIPAPLKIAHGTIWPKPDCYHVPLEPGLMAEAADLVEREEVAQPSFHAHVHDGKQVLLEWHDAFEQDPMYVATSVAQERVEAFALALGVGPVARERDTSG
jgi:hypothetical protein